MLKYYLYATVTIDHECTDCFQVTEAFDDLASVERYISKRWPKARKPSKATKYTWILWRPRAQGGLVKLQVCNYVRI